MTVPEKFLPHVVDLQIAMISILQERQLTIDQRLIVLGFFIDRLEEIFAAFDDVSLTKLIAAYESKKFLAEQVPIMLSAVRFDTRKFIKLMLGIFETLYGKPNITIEQQILAETVVDVLKIKPDEKISCQSMRLPQLTNALPLPEKIFWRNTQRFWKIIL